MFIKLKTVLGIIALVLCMLPVRAHALFTDDAGTTGFMKYSLDVYGQFGWDSSTANGVTSKTTDQLLQADLYAGLLDSVDLVIGIPLYWSQTDTNGSKTDIGGITDISLDLKWRFLELGPVSFAIKPGLVLPTGDRTKGLGADRLGYGCMLISTVEFKPLAVHANVGYVHQGMIEEDRPGSRVDTWKLALGAIYSLTDELRLKGEIVGITNGDRSSSNWPSFMTAQIAYDLNSHLSVNAGVRWGLTAPATDIVAITGFTVYFP